MAIDYAMRKALLSVCYTAKALTQALKQKAKPVVSYAGFDIPEPVKDDILALADSVIDADLADDGREDRPHVTVKYGMVTQNPDDVAAVVAGYPPVKVTLGGISVFSGAETGKDFDVVKLDIDGDDLRRLNALLSRELPHTDSHEAYRPHITLAYVKAGKGEQYAGLSGLEGQELTLSELTFSTAKKETTAIRLGGDAGPVTKSWQSVVLKAAKPTTDEPVDIDALAELLYGIYGQEVLEKVYDVIDAHEGKGTIEKAWRETDHPRGATGETGRSVLRRDGAERRCEVKLRLSRRPITSTGQAWGGVTLCPMTRQPLSSSTSL